MNPGRSRLEIGCYGDINVSKTSTRKYRAETRYRDWDGEVRKVTATGASVSAAKAALRTKLAQRGADSGFGQSLHADSPVSMLAEAWLEDVQMRTDLSDGTKGVYRRELHSLVLPAFKTSGYGRLRLDVPTASSSSRQCGPTHAHADLAPTSQMGFELLAPNRNQPRR